VTLVEIMIRFCWDQNPNNRLNFLQKVSKTINYSAKFIIILTFCPTLKGVMLLLLDQQTRACKLVSETDYSVRISALFG